MRDIPWGEIGYITFKRTYARKLRDTGSATEEYEDTIDRVINGAVKQLKVPFTEGEQSRLKDLMLDLKAFVAGRFMWQLGTKTVERLGLSSLQNCAFIVVDHPIIPFTWAFDMLMLGSGVGYNIQREYVYKLPKVLKRKIKISRQDTKDADFIVPDSREGWVKLLGKVLKSYFYSGEGFSYSTICIRGRGAPIKGFGGIASGPEDLVVGISNICAILDSRRGRQLRPIDCLDIMNIIGSIVVAGNVRRSAQIAIGDYDDVEFLRAKDWSSGKIPNWRAMSNNSIACNDFNDILPQFWEGYLGNGEPYGLINLGLSQSCGRLGETQYPDPDVAGYNPCLHPDTLIETVKGRMKIKDINEPTFVYSMDSEGKLCIAKASASWVSKKDARTIKLHINSGSYIECTPDHKIYLKNKGWTEAQNVVVGDEVVHLSRSRRGAAYAGVRLTTQEPSEQVMEHRLIYEGVHGIMPDDVHHINGNTYDNNISNLEGMSHSEHARLTAIEQPNDHQVWGENGDFVSGPNSRKGAKKIINMPEHLRTNLINKPIVVSITEGEVVDVYDMTVDGTHNFVANNIIVHNCAEQSLANGETCCLAEIPLPNITSLEELKEVATYLYRICKHSLAIKCHLKNTEDIVHKNMRMGIGITGYAMASEEQKSWLDETYRYLREYDDWYSKENGFNRSIKLTTIKPSGTLSLLAGVTPGAHPGYSHYFIRRVRIASDSPLVATCRNHGYDIEYVRNFDGTDDKSTVVVSFPCKFPEHTKVAKDVTAIDQLNTVKELQTKWSDNAVSVTVYYKLEELEDIKAWLKENYNTCVKSVSFLLHSNHGFDQAPYEEINDLEYINMASGVEPITKIEFFDDEVDYDSECSTGMCPVK